MLCSPQPKEQNMDTMSVTGIIATSPRHVVTKEGFDVTSFRLASTGRKFDRGQQAWVDSDTNWFTVVSFRQLAHNANLSLAKGDRVVVRGKLKVREWSHDDKSGTTVEIEAESLGHDLLWGTTTYERSSTSSDSDDEAEEEEPF
jgi:single-strand DNA-binding protein